MHVNKPCAIREEEFERSDTSSRSSRRRLPKYFGVVGKLPSATRTRTKEQRGERGRARDISTLEFGPAVAAICVKLQGVDDDSKLLVRVAQPVFPLRMRRAARRRRRNCVRDKKNRTPQDAHISNFVFPWKRTREKEPSWGCSKVARRAPRDRKRRIPI